MSGALYKVRPLTLSHSFTESTHREGNKTLWIDNIICIEKVIGPMKAQSEPRVWLTLSKGLKLLGTFMTFICPRRQLLSARRTCPSNEITRGYSVWWITTCLPVERLCLIYDSHCVLTKERYMLKWKVLHEWFNKGPLYGLEKSFLTFGKVYNIMVNYSPKFLVICISWSTFFVLMS